MLYDHPTRDVDHSALASEPCGSWIQDHPYPTGQACDAGAFLAQLQAALRQLRVTRLRFSIMRLVLPAGMAGDSPVARKVVARMASPHVMVGLWRDDSVIAAFFGPRACGSAGDGEQMRKIVQRCRRAMMEAGMAELLPHARLLIGHCWTDEVTDLPFLIEALDARGDRAM